MSDRTLITLILSSIFAFTVQSYYRFLTDSFNTIQQNQEQIIQLIEETSTDEHFTLEEFMENWG